MERFGYFFKQSSTEINYTVSKINTVDGYLKDTKRIHFLFKSEI